MRHGVVSIVVILSVLAPGVAHSQPLPRAAGPVIDLEDAPPSPQFTAAMETFKKEQWDDAAVQLDQVWRDEGNEIARFHEALSLHALHLPTASRSILSDIAAIQDHRAHAQALLWLVRIASETPASSLLLEDIGRYADASGMVDCPSDAPSVCDELAWFNGRRAYDKGQYVAAAQSFAAITTTSRRHRRAKLLEGASYIRRREPAAALAAFQTALDAQGLLDADPEHIADLAHLSIARTLYTTSIRPDERGARVDGTKLRASVRHWSAVPIDGPYGRDALYEQGWAYFMAGDFSRALGNVHSVQSPFFGASHHAGAETLQATALYAACHYDEASTAAAQSKRRWQPVTREIDDLVMTLEQDETGLVVLGLSKQRMSDAVRTVLDRVVASGPVVRALARRREMDDEAARFEKLSSAFQSSRAAEEALEALDFGRELALRDALGLVIAGLRDERVSLANEVASANAVLVAATRAARAAGPTDDARGPMLGYPKRDDDHVRWPFDGEYWRDEQGLYRGVVGSKCKQRP